MSKFRFHYFLYALATILATSCEDVVDLPIDESAKQLVIFSNFSDQNHLQVLVYKTKFINSKKPTEYVENANVNVFADGILLEKLHLVIPDSASGLFPYYQSTDLVPEYDKEYTIEVYVEGYDTITATNSIPTPVNIEEAVFTKDVQIDEDGHNTEVSFFTSLSMRDPINIENYYHLRFYQELIPFTLISPTDSLFGDTFFVYPNQVDLIGNNLSLTQYKYDQSQSYLIDDTLFDGQYITFQFNGKVMYDASKLKPGRFIIELRTVSKDYYLYHESLNWQTAEGGSPHGPNGGVVFNNIDNGVGNFSGFTAKVNEFPLSK